MLRLRIVAILAAVILAALAGPAVIAAPSAAPPLVPAHLLPGGPTVAAATYYYLQEGATLVAEGGTSAATLPSISATFALAASPYATGYEINGLSDTGDWYQGLATDNWPGCPSGFTFAYEVWNAKGTSVIGPSCDTTTPLSLGDTVRIDLSLTCAAASACFTFTDVTTGAHDQAIVLQPDAGATVFQNLATAADKNGYFTGPMTEIVDDRATSCGAYASLPAISYVIDAGGAAVSSYIPWSDEFAVSGTSTSVCYGNSGSPRSVSSDPTTDYVEASGGSAYGPHWVAGQNWTAVSGTAGEWRFQTDVTPLSLALAMSRTAADVGQNVSANATPSGGSGMVTCVWYAGETLLSATGCDAAVAPTAAGVQTMTAYAIDALSDYAKATASLTVSPALVVPLPGATRTTLDLGQTTVWTVNATGGSGAYVYVWTGLPLGCSGSAATLACTPLQNGTFSVRAAVTDSNENTVVSPAVLLQVGGGPTVQLLVSPTAPLAGQVLTLTADIQGGVRPYQVVWSGLPPGCAPSLFAATVTCTPSATGTYAVSVTVTDGTGYAATASVNVTVGEAVLGTPSPLGYGAATAIVAALLLAFVGYLVLRSRRRKNPPPTGASPPSPPNRLPPPPPPATPPPPPPLGP